jgi:protein-tyrosine phosphatase
MFNTKKLQVLGLVLALQITSLPAIGWANESAPVPSAAQAQSRTVALEGQKNFRDLGGYKTADGRQQVRWGRLYRSGSLARLTDQDYTSLAPLGIATVVDLRSTAERASEPTVWRAGEPELLAKAYNSKGEAALMAVLKAPDATPETVRQAVIGFYRQMPDQFADQYSEIFHHLAAFNSPLLFHCTAGKDRTGLASALILTVLGVPRDQVIADYVLTEKAGDFRGAPSPAAPAGTKDHYDYMRSMQAELIRPLMRADPAYLEAALDQIDKDYGSVQSYVNRKLGVSTTEIAILRAKLLEPVAKAGR